MERRSAATCSLRAWLNDDWALLFSHPDDFAQHDVEADRWLVLLHDAFAAAGVRPIALGSSSSAGAFGWLTQVNADSARVSLASELVCGDYRLLKINMLDNRSISDAQVEALSRRIRSTPARAMVFNDFPQRYFLFLGE